MSCWKQRLTAWHEQSANSCLLAKLPNPSLVGLPKDTLSLAISLQELRQSLDILRQNYVRLRQSRVGLRKSHHSGSRQLPKGALEPAKTAPISQASNFFSLLLQDVFVSCRRDTLSHRAPDCTMRATSDPITARKNCSNAS